MNPEPSGTWRKIVAECVGTFCLVFAGCGAIMVNDITAGQVTHPGVALTFGLVVGVMILATGHISGAHFNPAVTLAFASAGHFPWKEVPGYLAGQVVAAVLASAALYAVLGPVAALGATVPSGGALQALVLEAVLTFMLMFVIVSVATDARATGQLAALGIGGTVTLCALFGGPICGASMNPARSIGPAVLTGELGQLWIYLAGPIAGALLGAFVYRFVRCEETVRDAGGARGCC